MVTGNRLRLREGPSPEDDVVSGFRAGELLVAVERTGEMELIGERYSHWYRVRTLDGDQQGWVFGGFLALSIFAQQARTLVESDIDPRVGL